MEHQPSCKVCLCDALKKSLKDEIDSNKILLDELEKLQKKNKLLQEVLEEKDEIIERLLNKIRQSELIRELSNTTNKNEKVLPS